MAKDLAAPVENLIGIPVADRIRELEREMSREESALQLGDALATVQLQTFDSRDWAGGGD